jgi:CheY-like chemotaxis protein
VCGIERFKAHPSLQMPIVDGLTSTKMIRSFEKTHANIYSPRAAQCGRIPIIAVSASLVERNRQEYVDAGFDAWILKPISIDRLSKLMTAIVDLKSREECLYQPGSWEQGGWFHMDPVGVEDVSTKPSASKEPGSTAVEPTNEAEQTDPVQDESLAQEGIASQDQATVPHEGDGTAEEAKPEDPTPEETTEETKATTQQTEEGTTGPS